MNNGEVIVEKNGQKFVNVHEKIYVLNEGETQVTYDEEHHPTNAKRPLDFSITRNSKKTIKSKNVTTSSIFNFF